MRTKVYLRSFTFFPFSKFVKRYYKTALLLAVFLVVILLKGKAAVFTVTNSNDAGAGSFRQAVLDANAAGAGPHSIVFAAGVTVVNVTTAMPALTVSNVTIDGAGTVVINAPGGDNSIYLVLLGAGANNTTVRNLTLQNTGVEPLRITAANNGLTIESVVCRQTTGGVDYMNHAFYTTAPITNMTVRNMTITNIQDGYWGLRFGSTVNGLSVDGMSISKGGGTTARGVQFEGAAQNVTIKNSTIDLDDPATADDGDYGIYFNNTATNVTIDSITMHDAEIYGVFIGGVASNISVKHSSFDNFDGRTGTQMIRFNSTVNTLAMDSVIINLDQNATADDGDYGMVFANAVTNATLSKIRINEADADGIYLNNNVTDFLLTDSRFTSNFDGIEFYNAYAHTNVDIVNSTFTGHTRSGILVNAGGAVNDVLIQGDSIINNTNHGIWIHGGNAVSQMVITNNVIAHNNGAGINVDAVDKVNITQNSIYNNRLTGIDLVGVGNCGYEGANKPLIQSSTFVSGNTYDVQITLPAICAGGCTVELYATDPTHRGTGGQYLVGTFTNQLNGTATHTVTSSVPPVVGNPWGVWTATLRIPSNNCGTSEFSNKQPIQVNGPAGVNTGVNLWLRPDLLEAGNMVNGTGWQDFSGNNRDFDMVFGDPARIDTGVNFNYNVNFDGSDYLRSTASPFVTSFTAGEAIAVTRVPVTNTNAGNPYDFGSLSRGSHYTWGNAAIYNGFGTNQRLGWNPLTKTVVEAKAGVAVISGNGVDVKNWNIFATRSATGNWGVDFNGQTVATTSTNTVSFALAGANEHVGAVSGSVFNGDIAEEILYNRVLTPIERQRINSYLGIKYGLTLAHDYVASNGTTVWWSLTGNTGYNNDIAGFAKDNVSLLEQKQSRSVNSDDVVSMSLGNKFFPVNYDNTNSIATNLSAFVWGNNDASTLFSVAITNPFATARMVRVWKVDKTNWTDTILTLRLTKGNANKTLLISTDPAFATGVQSYPLTDTGTVLLNSSVFADGSYFTFGDRLAAPACVVAGIRGWYRADDANAVVGEWSDYSGNTNDATQAVVANQPLKLNDAINFNPGFNFDGSNDYFDIASNFNINGTNPHTVIAVGRRETLGGTDAFLSQQGAATNNFIHYWAANNHSAIGSTNVGTVQSTAVYGVANIPYFLTGTRTGNNFNLYTNGAADGAGTEAWTFAATNMRIGARAASADAAFDGSISEIIVYNRQLTAPELQAVHSYLALKYGITLSQATPTDYLASNGSIMWNAGDNTIYNKDIAGIGRDTCSNLHQKQSKSVNAGALVSIATGSIIAPDNSSNIAAISNNLSFFTWGDNGATTAFSVAVTGGNSTARMSRVWKADKTNWIDQDITIKYDGNPLNTYLLISNADAGFATINQEIAVGPDSTVQINSSLLPDGAYFTFGKQIKGPACINVGIRVWLDAATGLTAVTNGIQWDDKSGNDLHVAQTTDAREGTLGVADAAHNFNPYINFDGDDVFESDQQILQSATSSGSVFFVSKYRDFTGYDSPVDFDADDPHLGRLNASVGAYMNGSTPVQYFPGANQTLVLNQTHISGYLWNGGTNGGIELRKDAASAADATMDFNNIGFTKDFGVGGYITGAEGINGTMSEVIVYNRRLSAAEANLVESYLGIKYGISLDQTAPANYMASDATTIAWEAAANTGYNNDIAIIGRDDCPGLYQKQSRSANSDNLITIAAGPSIASSNAANMASIPDLAFFAWANDNGAVQFNTAISGLPNATVRMARVWKVDKNSNWTDQDITIKVEQSGERYLLIDSDDAAFDAATTTEYALNISNGTVTINTASIPDGAYFTVATKISGPGCVNVGILTWLRADYGVTDDGTAKASTWIDFSGSGNNFTQATATQRPVINAVHTSSNFNPTLYFNNSTTTDFLGSAGTMWTAGQPGSSFAAAFHNNVAGPWGHLVDQNDQPALLKWNLTPQIAAYDAGTVTTPVTVPQLPDMINNRTGIFGMDFGTTANSYNLYLDGLSGAVTHAAVPSVINGPMRIGLQVDNTDPWRGGIHEVAVYNRELSASELARVNSYFAFKYGVTLNSGTVDYVASNGTTTMWSAADNAGFGRRITGIGRDDCDELYQKQSLSVDTGTVTIAVGASIASSNLTNAASVVNDNSYFVFSDDGASTQFSVALGGIANVNSRMTRIFKVDKSANWGDGDITFNLASGNDRIYLVTSTDATFDGSDVFYQLDAGGNVTVNTSSINDASYFTFATFIVSPGCVNTPALWLKANDGVLTGDNVAVSSWGNIYGSTYNLVQATSAKQPTFHSTTLNRLVNYNPSLNFDGTDDQLTNPARLFPAASGFQLFTIGLDKRTVFTQFRATLGMGADGNYPALDFQTDGVSPTGYNPWLTGSTPVEWGSTSLTLPAVEAKTSLVGLSSSNASTAATNNVWATINGVTELTTLDAHQQAEIGNGTFIGSSGTADAFWLGYIPEIVIYDRKLSTTEEQHVNSYLAIKYGITLSHNYTSSGAVPILWDVAGADAAYNKNIAGIWRNDCSNLYQKQSRSVNDSSEIVIALNAVAGTNVANIGMLDNEDFLVWGANGTTGYTFNATYDGTASRRLNRVWKIRDHGNVGQVQLAIPKAALITAGLPGACEAYKIVVSNSSTDPGANWNATNSTEYTLSEQTVNGVACYTTTITFTSDADRYFTIGRLLDKGAHPYLVADGMQTAVAAECETTDWIYFLDPADDTRRLLAIKKNGNNIDRNDFAVKIDVSTDYSDPLTSALGKAQAPSPQQAVFLMRRLVEISFAPAGGHTITTPVQVRMYWDDGSVMQNEKQIARDNLNALIVANGINVVNGPVFQWFKAGGQDIPTMLTNLRPSGITGGSGSQYWHELQDASHSYGIDGSIPYVEFNNVSSFSVFGGGWVVNQVDNVILPVHFLGFEARKNGSQVQLSWKVRNEVNVHGYYVERSPDGRSWTSLGFVAALPAAQTNDYIMTDMSPLYDRNYYRIREVDVDGRDYYSPIRMLRMGEKINTVLLYPVPASHLLRVNIYTSHAVAATIIIRDMQGRELTKLPVQLTIGDNNKEIAVDKLAAGTYILDIITDTERWVDKFMKN